LALLAAISIWLSAGIVSYGGDTVRIAALPSISVLIVLAAVLPAAAWFTKLRLADAWPLAISLVLWLPFFPGRVPAAFLIWDGPIEGIVWATVIIGLIAARRPAVPAVVSDPAIAPWIAAGAVAIAALTVFSQVRGVFPGGDEPHYLAATQSILKDFDLRVANNYASGDYLDYFPGRLEPHYLKRATSGEIYSIHAPGVSFVVLPAFAVGGYDGAVITMILIAALTAALTWRLAFRVSGSSGGAWTGVAAVFATAPYFFHSFTIYPETIGSLCVMCGVWLLIELAGGRAVGARVLIAVGAVLATLPWLHSRFAVLAAVIGVLIVIRLRQRPSPWSRIFAFLVVPAVAGAAWFAFFYLIWGSASPMAPYGADTSTSLSYIPRGVIGLLFDEQFGVFATAPVYLIGFAGLIALWRLRPRLATEIVLIVIPYSLIVASYAMWWAGSAAPARFLVAVLPLAALPIATLVSTPAILLLLVSVAIVIPRGFVESGRFIINSRGGVDPSLRWLSYNVDFVRAVPSVHLDGARAAAMHALIWLVTLAIAAKLSVVIGRRRSMGASFAVAGTLGAAAVMIAATSVWSLHRGSPIDEAQSKLAAVARFRPAWQSTIVQWPELTTMRPVELLNHMNIGMAGQTMRLESVPAGEYEVYADPTASMTGSLQMFVGRTDRPIASPHLDDLRDPNAPFRLRLPVMVRTLNFRATEGQPIYTLRPVGVVRPATSRSAIRATRYGHARAFFFDEQAYPEHDGFWTRADGRALVVIDTDEGTRISGVPISITAGAVPTTVTLSVGTWEETFALAAGRTQDVTLPPGTDGEWVLAIRSGRGSRPSERDPGSRDVRLLAAWIAIH
jgi:hypothetical protein